MPEFNQAFVPLLVDYAGTRQGVSGLGTRAEERWPFVRLAVEALP